MTIRIRRREFVAALGGAVAAWPLAARGQQGERMRRIGMLMNLAADDPESSARLTAFVQALQQLGWTDGRNARIDIRWGTADPDLYRKYAVELVALAPDVIFAASGSTVPALLQATRGIPIVFAQTTDPVAAGFVSSLARPSGNATGFVNFEFGLAGKWLELLKQIRPGTVRVGVLRDIVNPTQGIPQFAAIQTVAPSLGVELTAMGVIDAAEIEKGIKDFARGPNDGLVVTASPLTAAFRALIISLAARHHLPAVYPFHFLPVPAVWSRMARIRSTSIAGRPATSIASSGARSPPTCRSKRRPSTSCRSISKPPRHLASPCHQHCWPAPTR